MKIMPNRMDYGFEKYQEEFDRFVFKMHKEDNTLLINELYQTYYLILKFLIENKKTEYFEYSLTMSIVLIIALPP